MNITIGFKIAQFFYKLAVRKIILQAVDNPAAEWDDKVMSMLDTLLGMGEEK